MANLEEKNKTFAEQMLARLETSEAPSKKTNITPTGDKEEKQSTQPIPSIIAYFLGEEDINALFRAVLLHAIRFSESDPDNPVKLSYFIEPSVLNQAPSLFLTELGEYLPQNISIAFNQDEAETQKRCNLPVLAMQGKTKYTPRTADCLEKWVSENNGKHTKHKAAIDISIFKSILKSHICPDFKQAYVQLNTMKGYSYACMEDNPILKNTYADFYQGIGKMYEALSSQIQVHEKEILTHTIGSTAYQAARNEFKTNIGLTYQCVAKVHSIKTQLNFRQTGLWQKDPINQEKRIKKILISGCKDLNNIFLSSSHKKSTVDNDKQEQIEGMPSCLQAVYRSFKKIIYTLQHPIDSISFFAEKTGLKKRKYGESIEIFTKLPAQLGK